MKYKKNLILVLTLLILFTGSTLIKAASYPIKITDDLGRQVLIKDKPHRIISLAPSYTETLFTLGSEKELVGVTKYADYPQAAIKIQKVGTIKEPNLEKIIQLKPDLVLAAEITPERIINRLDQLGIKVIGLGPQNINEIIETIEIIGRATGQWQEANDLTTDMKNRVTRVQKLIKKHLEKEQRPKVFYELWNNPLYTAGPDTFIDNLIYLAGGINIAQNALGKWPQYNTEVLLAQNPDVYFIANRDEDINKKKQEIESRDNFKNIAAIKNNKIYFFNPDIVHRAGPRIVIALEKMAKAIHPKKSLK
ncbi:ABC transporter substrate-binding protein [Selenihalanaerobacter shriftii]|uniref:Iron complex transport system substrate-binding protein n=1 Tax=Selenihalanaerobacter shriftii TaxID=142842 RepID=A0A1T4K0W1_9FIRM|nr:helical backbone metal receptor [Selenihalanaerobacter shriftii]SJZ36080.1 iron complex transport system substrate-binding protein [Selenihalanaerobacter shriftii]